MLDRNSNLYADIAARYAETACILRFASQFFDKDADRILYGTDMGYDQEMCRTTFRILETGDEHFYIFQYQYHWPASGFNLSDALLKKSIARTLWPHSHVQGGLRADASKPRP